MLDDSANVGRFSGSCLLLPILSLGLIVRNPERDINNGLLLSALWDSAFDSGLAISFD